MVCPFFFLFIPLLEFSRQCLRSRVIVILEFNKWFTDSINQEMLRLLVTGSYKPEIFLKLCWLVYLVFAEAKYKK